MNITGFNAIDEAGAALDCDAYAENAAVSCPVCSHPLLMTAVRNKKGSSASRATACPRCQHLSYLVVLETERKIIIHQKNLIK